MAKLSCSFSLTVTPNEQISDLNYSFVFRESSPPPHAISMNNSQYLPSVKCAVVCVSLATRLSRHTLPFLLFVATETVYTLKSRGRGVSAKCQTSFHIIPDLIYAVYPCQTGSCSKCFSSSYFRQVKV